MLIIILDPNNPLQAPSANEQVFKFNSRVTFNLLVLQTPKPHHIHITKHHNSYELDNSAQALRAEPGYQT